MRAQLRFKIGTFFVMFQFTQKRGKTSNHCAGLSREGKGRKKGRAYIGKKGADGWLTIPRMQGVVRHLPPNTGKPVSDPCTEGGRGKRRD